MRRLAFVAVLLAAAPAAWPGEVKIGMGPMGMYPKKCYVARFVGPDLAVARYEHAQKERFEKPEPAIVAQFRKQVLISVRNEASPERTDCTLAGGRPDRIVLALKGGVEPVLVIPLAIEERMLQNAAGAAIPTFSGSATLSTADLEQLAGKELDFHLVLADGVQKDKWRRNYSAKILNPTRLIYLAPITVLW